MRRRRMAAILCLIACSWGCGSLVGDYEVSNDGSTGTSASAAGGNGGSGGIAGDGGTAAAGAGGRESGGAGGQGGAPSYCGDQVIDVGEQCDDGNLEAGDGCDACWLECTDVEYAGSCYRADINMAQTWDQAEAQCNAWYGTLACISSDEEQEFAESFGFTGPVWIGGTDNTDRGDYQWVNGEPWGFTQWANGEPSTVRGANCVQLDDVAVGVYGWRARECEQPFGFLCERLGNPNR